jgi:hypothetical protein
MLAGAMHRTQPSPSGPPTSPTRGGPDGRVPPGELHAWRVAWGEYYGARISELTREWKAGLR